MFCGNNKVKKETRAINFVLNNEPKLLRQFLVKRKTSDETKIQALILACKQGNPNLVSILLPFITNGESVHANISLCSPITLAIGFKDKAIGKEIVDLLLEHSLRTESRYDANVLFHSRRLSDNVSPLHYACFLGHTDLLKSLVRAGFNIELISSNGFRPVHYAAMQNEKRALETLSDLNADLDVSDNTEAGNTPLHLTVQNNCYVTTQ